MIKLENFKKQPKPLKSNETEIIRVHLMRQAKLASLSLSAN